MIITLVCTANVRVSKWMKLQTNVSTNSDGCVRRIKWITSRHTLAPCYVKNMPPGAPRISLDSIHTEMIGLIYATDENLRFFNPIMMSLLCRFEMTCILFLFDLSLRARFQWSLIIAVQYFLISWIAWQSQFLFIWSVPDAIHCIRKCRESG